jgi:hypothetical protein
MYSRNCPKCGKVINYRNKRSFLISIKQNTNCGPCRSAGINKGKKASEKTKKKLSINNSGSGNGFFGKNHTKQSKDAIKNYNIGKTYSDETNKTKGLKGELNPRYGKNNYDSWLKKYGEKEANEKLNNFKKKASINSSGKNNPMYGKPSPTGSGNGWSGWYKNKYFRSLRELSFIIYYIERFNLKYETGESKKYQIKYKDNEVERNYYPDFFISNHYLVEIKPIKLWNSRSVLLKKEAAIRFCEERGLKYKLIDPIKLVTKIELMKKIEMGELQFLEKYQLKLNNYES